MLLCAALFLPLSTKADAGKELVASFDFALSPETDQTAGRAATFHEGELATTPQPLESDGKTALAFNGSQALVLPSKGLVFGDKGIAFEAWVRINEIPSQGQAVIAAQAGRFLLAVRSGGFLSAQLLTLPERTALTSMGDGRLIPGVWHRVELLYDGTQTLLSLDDRVVAQQESPGSLAGSSNPIVFGGRFANPGDFTSGENRLIEGFNGELAAILLFRFQKPEPTVEP